MSADPLEPTEQPAQPARPMRPVMQLSRTSVECAKCGRKKGPGGLIVPEPCGKGEEAMTWEWEGRVVCVPCYLEAYPPSAAKVAPPTRAPVFQQLKDSDPFPFGPTWKGTPMEKVPAAYLDWLRGQAWHKNWPAVADYIERNAKAIDLELKRRERER